MEKQAHNKTFIQLLRTTYNKRLQEHAIINVRYSQASDFIWGHIYKNIKTKKDEILNLKTDKREAIEEIANIFLQPTLNKERHFIFMLKMFIKV